MEGGRYFRTGAYEKEKYFIESISPSTVNTIPYKCEESVMNFWRKREENIKFNVLYTAFLREKAKWDMVRYWNKISFSKAEEKSDDSESEIWKIMQFLQILLNHPSEKYADI